MSNTLSLYGNLLINPNYSNTIIGIQCGVNTNYNNNTGTVTFPYSFPSSNIIVMLTPTYGSGIVNTPQLAGVTNDGFSWAPIQSYFDMNGGSYFYATYNIYWIAICYS
jgi:hypothetical protein